MSLAQSLAEKSYYRSIKPFIDNRLKNLIKFIKSYSDNNLEDFYNNLSPERKKLVCPIEPIWEEKLKEWIEYVPPQSNFFDNKIIIYTEKGERVKSKSEKILADSFFDHKIEYKYEKPLYLNGYGYISPDFTFFPRKKGKEIYWEHFGKMDNPKYAVNAIKK